MMERPPKRLQGPPGLGPLVEGRAIVSKHGFNARYDLNRVSGVFSRPEHDHFGASPAGKIFFFSTPRAASRPRGPCSTCKADRWRPSAWCAGEPIPWWLRARPSQAWPCSIGSSQIHCCMFRPATGFD